MVIDSSALVAILQGEGPAPRLVTALETAVTAGEPCRVSAAAIVETGIVVEALRGEGAGRELDLLLHRLRADIVPVTAEQAELGRDGYRRFGKGRHPAGLNFGGCFSYALAISLGEPLLFVGDDFARTDVPAVRY